MQFQPNVRQVRTLISRRIQLAFIAGLLLGILLGWLFSGVVSAVMRVGIVALLLIPLAIAIYFWWKIREASKSGTGGATIVSWSGRSIPQDEQDLFGSFRSDRDIIDADVVDSRDDDREIRR